ncbi:MAG: YCF48-related protein, partial [Ignavibacteria bacterium]|nr:YCF48-related protein [Ignavibacteria bacterium]
MNSVNQKSDAKILSVLLLILLMMPASLFSQSGWYKLNSPTSSDLRAVCFKDALHGCVIGKDVLFITVNGGQSWVNIENIPVVGENDYFTFESLCYTNTTTGWIAGDLYVDPPGMHHKIILKTEDAGNSWLYSYCAESESGL